MQEAKEFLFADDARAKLKEGVDVLSEIAAMTLGPNSKNIAIDLGFSTISSCSCEIVKEIELKDRFVNMGVLIGKNVVAQMKKECGDGSATSLIILKAMLSQLIKNITAGYSPIMLKRGADKATSEIIKNLKKNAAPIKTKSEILNLAISASGDEDIGKIITEALEKVNNFGTVLIEENEGIETTIEMVDGLKMSRGYISGYFATDASTLETLLQDCKVLVTDKRISSAHDILPILQTIGASGEALLIIADDVDSEALSTLVINKLKGILKVAAIRSPEYGDLKKELLQDICAITGASLISEDVGKDLKKATINDLGRANKIIITKDHTTIIGGHGDKKMIKDRIKSIESLLKESTSYDKKKLYERKAQLEGGVALLKVGGATETELKNKKQIFENCLNSTRAALEDGILPGGGCGLLRAAKELDLSLFQNEEERLGANAVVNSCEAPFKQIVANNGESGTLVLEQILKTEKNFGFNAKTGKIENLLELGIIDPTKVLINALILASSAATTIMLSEILIKDAEESS